MFRSAQLLASGSPSTACTLALGTSWAMDRAMAPDPVPRSPAPGSATFMARSRSIAQPVIPSVSGRGTNTPGPTSSSRYRKYAWPVMCCSGSRAARRAISDQNRASKAVSGTVCSSPRRTRCTLAAISSASARGDSPPASASRAAASATSSSSRLIIAGDPGIQLRGQVRGGQRVDHPVEITVDDPVQVVGPVAHAVIGDAVLREVVGADPFGPVHGADLAAPLGAGLRVRVGLGLGQQPRPQHAQRLLLVLQLALLV